MDSLLPAAVSALTVTQNASAVTFAGLLVIHLSAPIIGGTIGGEAGASGWMLIGRELYQGAWTEKVVVFGSVIVHVSSGVLRRGALAWQTGQRRRQARASARATGLSQRHTEDSPSTDSTMITLKPAWPRLSLHSITGYLLILPLLHHIGLHRLIPSSIGVDMSYAFPASGLRAGSKLRRSFSAVAYTLLTSLATWHALVGIRSISSGRRVQSLKAQGRLRPTNGFDLWQVSYASIMAGVGLGVVRIVATSGQQPAWIARGWERILRHGWAELT